MDRSYRLKMESQLDDNIVAEEILINCCKKSESKIIQLAYKEKQFRDIGFNNFKQELTDAIEYRKSFMDVLVNDYCLTLSEIKQKMSQVKEKNVPTKAVCDRVREIILNGNYALNA